MKQSASPFYAQTGELLPAHRNANLRSDLATASVLAVERYLQRDATEAHAPVATETMLKHFGLVSDAGL